MKRRLENFGIVDYVHLTYENATRDNTLTRFNKKRQLDKRYKAIYKELEDEFQRVVGVSSKDFMKASQKMDNQIEIINKMFTSETLEDLKDILSEDKQKQLKMGAQALEELTYASKTVSYSNILGIIYNGGKAEKEKIEEAANSFVGIDLYEQFLDHLDGDKRTTHYKNQQRAMLLYLLTQIAQESKKLKIASYSGSTFTTNFDWNNKSFDDFHHKMEQFAHDFSRIPKTVKEVDKLIASTKKLTDTNIKGALVGEFVGGVIAKNFLAPALLSKAKDFKIEHTGKNIQSQKNVKYKTGKNFINLDSSKAIANFEDLEDVILKYKVIDKKADIVLKYNFKGANHRVPVSIKTLKSTSRWVNVATDISLGAALAFSDRGESLQEYYMRPGIRGQLFNALNFYLLKDEYGIKKNDAKTVAEVFIEKSNSKRTSTKIDADFGGILSALLIDILGNFLSPKVSAFIDIDGIFIPTPVYYKHMMEKFLVNTRITVDKHITFHKDYNKNMQKNLLDPSIAKAIRPSKKEGYHFNVPALKRNQLVKENILNEKIDIKTDFIKVEDFMKIKR